MEAETQNYNNPAVHNMGVHINSAVSSTITSYHQP